MKTLILESDNKTIRAEIKADIFAKNTEIADTSFDAKFTNMEVVVDDTSIIAGVNEKQVINTYKGILGVAIALNLNMYVIDINENSTIQVNTQS